MKNRIELSESDGLLGHLADVMLFLENESITIEEAKAQASLVKQSNNLLRYELDCQKFKAKMAEEEGTTAKKDERQD